MRSYTKESRHAFVVAEHLSMYLNHNECFEYCTDYLMNLENSAT
jgi:hypothetical protein